MNDIPCHSPEDELALLNRAAGWRPDVALSDLSAEAIREVSREHGIDFATAVLYDRLRRREDVATLISALATRRRAELHGANVPKLVALVPGAFYSEQSDSGADGQAIRREMSRHNVPCEVIPIQSFGAVDANAQIVSQWLSERREQSIALVSLSKGGVDVKLAMQRREATEAFQNVSSWINLSGITEHNPLADWVLKHPWRSLPVRAWCRWNGYDFGVIRQFARCSTTPWSIPDHTRVIHVVGFPLARHLSTPLSQRGHRRVAALGPNDAGGNVLAEVATRPGTVLPVWGCDHYLRCRDVSPGELLCKLLSLPYADNSITTSVAEKVEA